MLANVSSAMPSQAVGSLFALAVGFAVAGLCANGYRVFCERFPSLLLLESGPSVARFAAIPLLMLSAPFIIMRHALRSAPLGRRRFTVVMLATVIAGVWSLMSGTAVVLALHSLIGA